MANAHSRGKVKAILLNDTMREAHHGCLVVSKNLRELASIFGIEITISYPVGTSHNLINAKFKETDCVIVNGEGTFSRRQPRRDQILNCMSIFLNENVPVYLINTSIGLDFTQEQIRVLQGLKTIWTRDQRSSDNLASLGVGSKVAADLTFYGDYLLASPAKLGDMTPSIEKRHPSKKIGVTDNFRDDISAILWELRRRIGAEYLPAGYFPKFDLTFFDQARKVKFLGKMGLNALARGLGSTRESAHRFSHVSPAPELYRAKISGLKYLISGRFHASCFAIGSGIPFIALEDQTYKMTSLIEQVGLQQWRLISPRMIDSVSLDSLFNMLEQGYSPGEINSIRRYISKAQYDIPSIFRQIKVDVDKILS